MQLIDANDVYKIIGDTGIKRVHVADIDQIKRIDPESLPVVQQLRANLELSDQEMQNLLKSMESLYKQRDELRAELERVKKERDAAVRNVLAADAVKVVHARWEIRIIEGKEKACCSHCNQPNKLYTPPYCPHCGARMDKED